MLFGIQIYSTLADAADNSQIDNDEENNPSNNVVDIEDLGSKQGYKKTSTTSTVKKYFRNTTNLKNTQSQPGNEDLSLQWKDVLGAPPPLNRDEVRQLTN